MRNLFNIRFGSLGAPDVSAACWDPERDEVLCTVGPVGESGRIELLRVTDGTVVSSRSVTSWDAPSPSPDLPVDKVVSLHYLSGTATTCLVLEGGDIVTIQEDEVSDGAHIEIVGSIDAGISAARWSPDEELLTVVTKASTVIFMGSTFDPVAEVPMTAEDLKASKHVSVGWGKKETQFQGRGAKAMRDPTIPEKVDQGVLSPNDDASTSISWRGDGAYVAVNAVEGERRLIRVYSREGELDSASEPVDGLEGTLSWRPSGNLMAGIQRFQDRVDVAFFERNGLRHGQFTLRSPTGPVTAHERIRLEWNSDSTVLAVILRDMVQLWTMGNYHWYLKQEIPLDSNTACLSWHPEKALRFAAATTTSVFLAEHIFHTARGSCREQDNGAVAVIDGDTVKLTPFRTANVPPPMSLYEITAASAVVDVAFGRQNSSFLVLHHKGVDVYELPMENGRAGKPVLISTVPMKKFQGYGIPVRVSYTSEGGSRIFVYEAERGNVQYTLQGQGDDAMVVLAEDQNRIIATASYERGAEFEIYGQDQAGKIYQLNEQGNEVAPIQFSTQLPWFEVAKVDETLVGFGLSRNGHLYADNRLLAKNCTSFVVTYDHLILTTNNHYVKFVHLTSDVEDLEVPADDPEKDERCRSVERGSRLVTAIPTNMSIILQMPRGNLETIYPRAMVVAGIRTLIDEKNYARAFSYCRTQRVDMNILYDHQPEQFQENVGLFLDQIRDVSYIDLFLSSLREEDVTQTMYKDTRRPKNTLDAAQIPPSPNAPSKVNTVCDALLKDLQPRKSTHLQNIISAHVCKNPPALDDGLTLVAELMREDDKVAEKAVEHICFLVDVNRLYENALGLYNLDLALLVAQQSQRDPREYLPFIQELHALPELRRKFVIDDHLERRTKALDHLKAIEASDDAAFDELCKYTTKHNLYHDALKLYRYDAPKLHTLTGLYAEYLQAISSFREAGLAYESLGDYPKATSCYRAAGATCWQECLATAGLSPAMSPEAKDDLASTLADALWEAKDYDAVATIYQEYLNNTEMAVKALCKGYHFAKAIRLVLLHRASLLETAIDTGLAEALGSTTEFLADCKGQLTAQVPRIADLRRKAAEDPLAFYEGERAGGMDIPDDVSVAASSRASTSASLFTRYTGKAGSVGTVGTGVSRATSKNRRREEKKRARGRKGTVYEEEYLVNSVRRLIERVEATKPDVERLVFALVRRGMPERARAAEGLMAEVAEACTKAVAEVFPQEEKEEQEQGEVGWRATGGEAVLQDFVEGMGKKLEAPIVTGMQKLTLLGS